MRQRELKEAFQVGEAGGGRRLSVLVPRVGVQGGEGVNQCAVHPRNLRMRVRAAIPMPIPVIVQRRPRISPRNSPYHSRASPRKSAMSSLVARCGIIPSMRLTRSSMVAMGTPEGPANFAELPDSPAIHTIDGLVYGTALSISTRYAGHCSRFQAMSRGSTTG